MTTALDDWLKQKSALAEAATSGPWVAHRPFLNLGHMDVAGVIPRANLHPEEPYQVRTEHNHDTASYALHVAVPANGSCHYKSDAAMNMEFIADARTSLPKALEIICVLKEALENCAGGDLASGEGVYKAEIARAALAQSERIANDDHAKG